MVVKLYNTYSNSKEEFVPVEAGKVKFYMCGPTVYDYIHIGNARAFIVFDVLRRFLEYLDYDVKYVMNLTDIDDNIIERAQKESSPVEELTKKYSEAFFEDIEGLGIKKADVHPRATENIKEIIDLIQQLIEGGFAYEVDGDVFYDVAKFESYGKLSGKKIDELMAGARVSVHNKKRNPLDFALWKNQKPGEPAWESPWGKGRPGWHIECSTMSMKYLGNSFDIHAGGVDLIFPHHENEIAQSESATKRKFVKYWLHNGFLKIDGEKMAKSLGNFRTVREILKEYPGVVLRMFFLQKHYRSPIDLTAEGLQSAAQACKRLKIFYDKLSHVLEGSPVSAGDFKKESLLPSELGAFEGFEKMREDISMAMADDLNSPVALSKLFEMVRDANKILSKDGLSKNERLILASVKRDFETMDSFFGILDRRQSDVDVGLVNNLMQLIIEVRKELRAKKEWGLADKIRDRLNEAGIILEDKGVDSEWRLK